MKVWITQCALTKGVVEEEVDPCSTTDNMIRVKDLRHDWYCHGKGKNWHTDLESAKKRANVMKDAKIKSLEKSLKKTMNLNFD